MSNLLSTIEAQRLSEQERLDVRYPMSQRNRLGQFSTPYPLARQMVEYVLNLRKKDSEHESIRFLDPAVGTGVFFSALKSVMSHKLIQCAVGIEIDKEIAQTTQQLWEDEGLEVIHGDFTTTQLTQTYNLMVANPPYVRHHHLSKEQKAFLQQKVKFALNINVSGLSGLYIYFMLLANQYLETGGIAAWLVPSEFMDVNYGAALRAYLTESVTLRHIHRFSPDDVQFDDALVSSAIVIYEKKIPLAADFVSISQGGSLNSPTHTAQIPLARLKTIKKWSALSEESITGKIPIKNSYKPCVHLKDLFKIRRGIVTGANDFFILKRHDAQAIGLPQEFLRPILPSPRYLSESIITANNDGFPNLATQWVLIDSSLPLDTLKRDFPRLGEYLQKGIHQGIHQGYLTSRRSPWYRQEQRDPAPFLCTYMGRSQKGQPPFRFFWNQSQAIAPNVYLMLYPLPSLAAYLAINPTHYEIVHQSLNEITAECLITAGRTYGGALHKIEPNELGEVEITGWDEVAMSTRQLTLF